MSMIVCAVLSVPIGNSMLPPDCRNEGKETTVKAFIPTAIRVNKQQELHKLMRDDPERFAGCGWVAIPEKPEPQEIKKRVTHQLGIWGQK